jgi:hypothetical protein
MEMILLGGACEDLWLRLIKRKALTEYRDQPHVRDIRQERAPIRDAPRASEGKGILAYARRVAARRQERARIPQAVIDDISEGIDDILDHARRAAGQATPKFKRSVNIPLKRPKGERDRIRRVVVRWARCAHRIVVSPRRVADCWEQYRKDFPTDVDFHTK